MRTILAILIFGYLFQASAQRIEPTIQVDSFGNASLVNKKTNNFWLVKAKPNRKPNIDKKLKAKPKNKSKHFAHLNVSRLEIYDPELLNSILEDVESITPDTEARINVIPTDPMWGQQWDMVNISMPAAWDVNQGSDEIIVAIFDTGIDLNHPDLVNNLVTGWQCLDGILAVGGMDDYGHGTHVAGTIGAVANNGIGICGLNIKVKLMPMKFMDKTGNGWTSDFLELLDKAIELKASGVNIRVGNNSWGTSGVSTIMTEAFQKAEDAGILSVCAAGNSSMDLDSNEVEPGGLPNRGIISVIATDSLNNLAGFSNYGLINTDVAAPGVSVLSTVPTNMTSGMWSTTGFQAASGTSMSSPHVAGLAALALSANPNLSVYELKDLLLNQKSTDPLSGIASVSSTGAKINGGKTLTNPLINNPKTNAEPSVYNIKSYDAVGGKPASVSFLAKDPDGESLRMLTIDRENKHGYETNDYRFTPLNRFLPVTMPFFVGASDRNGGSSGSNITVNVLTDPETFKLQQYQVGYLVTNTAGIAEILTRTWVITNSDPTKEILFKPYISGKGFNGWSYDWLPIGSGYTTRYNFAINTNGSYMLKSYTDNYQLAPHDDPERVILRMGTDVTNTTPFPVLNVRLDKLSGLQPCSIGFFMTNLSNLNTNNTFTAIGKSGRCRNCIYVEGKGAFFNGTITLTDLGSQTITFLVQDHQNDNLWDIKEFRVSVTAPPNPEPAPIPPPSRLDAPTDLSVEIIGRSMVMNWFDNSLGEDRYEVEMTSKQQGKWPPFRKVAELPPNSQSYQYSFGVKNSNYQFRVRSGAGTNVSEYSNTANIRFK